MFQDTDNDCIISEAATPPSSNQRSDSRMTVQQRQFQLNRAFKEYSKGEITEEVLRKQEAELEIDYVEAFFDQTTTTGVILPTLKRWIQKLTQSAGKK